MRREDAASHWPCETPLLDPGKSSWSWPGRWMADSSPGNAPGKEIFTENCVKIGFWQLILSTIQIYLLWVFMYFVSTLSHWRYQLKDPAHFEDMLVEMELWNQLVMNEKTLSPDHRLIPTSSRCHIDSVASVYLEASSCSSEREKNETGCFDLKTPK